ncbi:hypothetical protein CAUPRSCDRAFT_12878 [Caulochytrium protostelioides]|uniref:Uncharacterized protein n=1 Tax=Caulochytrium protostelioides TaxID=1555241 RepID=A0A4V1IT10_9FUNG|nr:hypothetical protein CAUPRSCDRAFT_12878 [Caulochytrium protostelioides]
MAPANTSAGVAAAAAAAAAAKPARLAPGSSPNVMGGLPDMFFSPKEMLALEGVLGTPENVEKLSLGTKTILDQIELSAGIANHSAPAMHPTSGDSLALLTHPRNDSVNRLMTHTALREATPYPVGAHSAAIAMERDARHSLPLSNGGGGAGGILPGAGGSGSGSGSGSGVAPGN